MLGRIGVAIVISGSVVIGCSGDDDSAPAEAFCEANADLEAESADDLGTYLNQLEGVADEAPEEIQGDIETLVDAAASMQETAGDASDPDRVQAALDQLDVAELQEASERVEAFVGENC